MVLCHLLTKIIQSSLLLQFTYWLGWIWWFVGDKKEGGLAVTAWGDNAGRSHDLKVGEGGCCRIGFQTLSPLYSWRGWFWGLKWVCRAKRGGNRWQSRSPSGSCTTEVWIPPGTEWGLPAILRLSDSCLKPNKLFYIVILSNIELLSS